jgi:hypothetical protein
MVKSKVTWNDIDKRRNMLLAQTSWTQLGNGNLTEESVNIWKRWRKELTSVNSNNFELAQAVVELERLYKNKPFLEYTEELREVFEQPLTEFDTQGVIDALSDKVFGPDSLKKLIREVLSEDKEENPLLDDFSVLEEAKDYIVKEIHKSYRFQIGKVSPEPELTQLYIERLNQAIDYLSGVGTSFPLLEVLVDNTGKDIGTVAADTLRSHTDRISSFIDIEDRYLKTLKAVEESDRIDHLREISENFFNGYRY